LLTNKKPPYRYGQKPMLAEKYLGKLLTVEKKTGNIVAVHSIVMTTWRSGNGGRLLHAATTNGAQVLKIDPASFKVVAKYPLPSPLVTGYDKERGVLIAQLYVEHPHLAVVDLKTGKVPSLWSDESARVWRRSTATGCAPGRAVGIQVPSAAARDRPEDRRCARDPHGRFAHGAVSGHGCQCADVPVHDHGGQ
jgi:hypothetical protein